jgi:two-component system response regulator MprA
MTRIVIADDEPVLLRGLQRYLTGLGYEVATAANGYEAIAAIDESVPDLLITDINMPDMDGIEILNTLRSAGSALPVIAMSGGGQFNRALLLSSARVLGAVVTLEKPFDLEALKALVEEVLAP